MPLKSKDLKNSKLKDLKIEFLGWYINGILKKYIIISGIMDIFQILKEQMAHMEDIQR